ncbi:tape measure protein [Brevundimonas balnearis]|uniref:Tape measure protein n=1 Tax=Brevundimonas balnearis TaxID=1572858 RepID=A0ABV6R0Z7_9CAUL
MATDQERLVLQMSADLRSFEREMARSRQITERRMREVEQRALQADRNLSRIMGQAGRSMVDALRASLTDIAPTLAAAFSAAQVIQYADAWTAGRNALSAAGVAAADLATRQNELVDLANETRTGTAETIALYQRLSIATAELGLSQQDTLRLTELLNKSFASSGLSTQEAASAALQLSQALASGVLQGDELRSLRENAPLVAKAIADSMGVGIGALKELGAEGKITADVIVGALFGASDQINATFDNTATTVGQALQRLNNELGRYVGEADESLSATERLAQAIVALANNLDRIIPVATTLATVIGVSYGASLAVAGVRTAAATVEAVRYQIALAALTARQTGATTAQVLLNGAMAANPIGLVVTVVAALAAGLLLLAQRYDKSRIAAEELAAATETSNDALRRYEEALRQAERASGDSAVAARRNAEAMREEAQAAITAARALAAKRTAEAQAALQLATRSFQEVTSGAPRDPAEAAGQLAFAAGAQRQLQRAQEDAAAAIREQIRQENELRRIQEQSSVAVPTGGGTAGGTERRGAGERETRDNTAELAARRAELDLEMQIQLARAQGREADAAGLERRLEIMQLTQRLEAAGVEDAQTRATVYYDALEAAERTRAAFDAIGDKLQSQREAALEAKRIAFEAQEQADRDALDRFERARDDFRYEFVGAMRQVIEGDLGGAFESLADRFANRLLERAADGLFDALFSGGGAGGGGGNFLSLIFSAFGRRATGGAVTRGQPYIVGERRPEVFVPSVNGTVIPSINAAMAKMGQGQSARQDVRVQIDVNDDRFNAYVDGRASPMALQAGQASFNGARQAVPADLARQSAYRRR